jgi:hypothetical protein
MITTMRTPTWILTYPFKQRFKIAARATAFRLVGFKTFMLPERVQTTPHRKLNAANLKNGERTRKVRCFAF